MADFYPIIGLIILVIFMMIITFRTINYSIKTGEHRRLAFGVPSQKIGEIILTPKRSGNNTLAVYFLQTKYSEKKIGFEVIRSDHYGSRAQYLTLSFEQTNDLILQLKTVLEENASDPVSLQTNSPNGAK